MVKARRTLLTIVVPVVAVASLALAIIVFGSAGTYISSISGIPVPSDQVTETTTVPPNVHAIIAKQQGIESISIYRAEVVSVSPVMEGNTIKGFKVVFNLKSPSQAYVKVTIVVGLDDGSSVSASTTVLASPGENTVTLNLPSSVDPDHLVEVKAYATPQP